MKRIDLEMVFDCPKRLYNLFEKYSSEKKVLMPDIFLICFSTLLFSFASKAPDDEIFKFLDCAFQEFKIHYIADRPRKNGGDLN